MSKRCAKCEKAVYPIEELKCLDKTWHKACFRCWECGMTLNMKNYKGYDKKPYCSAHYPTTKFTQVAITPELARIAQNTKLQSQVQYHEDFEKNKGHYTCVTDDPETKRLMENTRKNSLIQYHEEYEQNKYKYTQVADDQETQRLLENTRKTSLIQYHEDFEKNRGKYTVVADDPETQRLLKNTKKTSLVQYHSDFEKNRGHYTPCADDMETQRNLTNSRNFSSVKYHEEYEKMKGTKQSVVDDPELLRHRQNTSIVSNVEYWGLKGRQADQEQKRGLVDKDGLPQTQMRPPGGPRPEEAVASPYSAKNQGNSVVYSTQGKVEADNPRNVGSIADYDPMNNQFGSITGPGGRPPAGNSYGGREWVDEVPAPHQGRQEQPHYPASPHHAPPQQQQHHAPPPQQHQDMRPPQEQAPPPPPSNNPLANAVFQALYDYEAKDYDEVGFREGDTIVNPEPIDEGWMYGTVKRTGKTGMLPANYVQRIQ